MNRTDYSEIRKQIDAMEETLSGCVKEVIIQVLREEVFDLYPEVTLVSWTQYTPYWNDGDPCVFRCRTYSARIFTGSEDAWEDEDPSEWSIDYSDHWDGDSDIVEAVEKALGAFQDKDFLYAFGDHAEVTIYRDRVEVEEYNHD